MLLKDKGPFDDEVDDKPFEVYILLAEDTAIIKSIDNRMKLLEGDHLNMFPELN